jgi:hypothetical protein
MVSLSSESMEPIIRELGNVCAAQTFSVVLYCCTGGRDVLTWNIYKLQGFSGNSITWLKVYIGFGLGEMHISSPISGNQITIFCHSRHSFVSVCENISYGDSQGVCIKVRSSSISWSLLQNV